MGVQERRAREREARKNAILDAARALLLERGFAGATTKQIAQRCELSEATVFFYFKTKDEVLASLLFECIEFWRAGLERIASAELTPEQTLARVWRFFGHVLKEHPEYYQLSAYLARPLAAAEISDEVRAEIVARSGENFQLLADILGRALDGPDNRLMADLLWSSFFGLTLLRESRRNLNAARHPTVRDMERILALLGDGLLSGADAKEVAR